MYQELSNKDIAKLALEIYRGEIFTDRHIREGEGQDVLGMIFMPLIMMNDDQRQELIDNPPGLVYEYRASAGPRAINGYPMFSSCRFLAQEAADKVWKKYKEIRASMESIEQEAVEKDREAEKKAEPEEAPSDD